MASNVPKFTSFRPKPKATLEPPSKPQHEKAERWSKDKVSRKRTSLSPDRTVRVHDSNKNKPYFSDRRGDPDVLRYGTMNRYDIPPHRRIGHGFILGISLHQKIDREHSTDRNIVVTPANRKRQDRLLTDKRANKSNERALRLLKMGRNDAELDQDFVSLSTHTKRKRNDSEEEDDQLTTVADYRCIDGPKPSQLLDPDTQYESDPDVVIDTQVTRENSQLVRQTKEQPQDVQGWLALAQHQEAMLKLERPSTELTLSDKAHLADIRISIYEEALKKIGSNQNDQLKLYQGLLKEAERAWDGAKLAKKWEDVLAKFPHSVHLWMMYLDFVQSRFTSFKYEECRATFFKCIESLHATKTDMSPEQSLHLLLRLTSMAHDAGYQELGLAVWQALLEYHLLRAEADAGAHMQAFEEFWESEVPRIGEPGAKGWRHSSTDDAPPPGPSPLRESQASDTIFEDFRKREMEATSVLRYPGRTSDNVAEDDAFHTIFFSDLEPYLTVLAPDTPATLLTEAFLCFCGLPSLPHRSPQERTWWSDPFLQRHWHSAPLETDENSTEFTKNIKRFSNYSPKSFQMTSELLFEQSFSLDAIRLDADFIRRLLKLLALEPCSEDILGEYLLAFEMRHFPSEAFKTAKRLLKARPSSLRLYNAYGLVESRLGNRAKADQVFSMALSMQQGDNFLSTPGSLELLSNWVWEALGHGEHKEALWRLCSPRGTHAGADTTTSHPTPALTNATLEKLNQITESALLHHDVSTAILSTSLLTLLAYLTTNLDLTAALTTHTNLTTWLTTHHLTPTPLSELHAQSLSPLLTHHATHTPILPPSLLCSTLDPLLTLHPSNTLLLSLYAANESRSPLDNDRIRSVFRDMLSLDHASNHDSKSARRRRSDTTLLLPAYAFALHYEALKAARYSASTQDAVRALFKRATSVDAGHTGQAPRSCPALWKRWLAFEIEAWMSLREMLRRVRVQMQMQSQSEDKHDDNHASQMKNAKNEKEEERAEEKKKKKQRLGTWETRVAEAEQRVRETFYAGVKQVPWCKEFVMLAFGTTGVFFSDEERRALYRVMLEKEMRVYVEVE